MPRQKTIRTLPRHSRPGQKTRRRQDAACWRADTEEGLKCVADALAHGLGQAGADRRQAADREGGPIARNCRFGGMEMIDEPDPTLAAIKGVAMCREGQADILMKGTVNTDMILRAILDRDNGLAAADC